ncbi:MAG: hypothetical protein FWF05_08380 [Oscillospiraceae bacterium]|nr:hypothetical protein [Oscillospiraceae bacterium]
MNDKQWKQIQEQLPQGAKILRSYRAFEGDVRVIARLPGEDFETRYSIKWDHENDCPRIELMP